MTVFIQAVRAYVCSAMIGTFVVRTERSLFTLEPFLVKVSHWQLSAKDHSWRFCFLKPETFTIAWLSRQCRMMCWVVYFSHVDQDYMRSLQENFKNIICYWISHQNWEKLNGSIHLLVFLSDTAVAVVTRLTLKGMLEVWLWNGNLVFPVHAWELHNILTEQNSESPYSLTPIPVLFPSNICLM